MKKAAKLFCTTTNYTSFAKITKHDDIDPVKSVSKISIIKKDSVILIKVEGERFFKTHGS